MTYSTHLRAEYAALANNCLDAIPIEEPEDFRLVQAALSAIAESRPAVLPKHLKREITVIKELVVSPALYIEDRAQHPGFRMIVLSCIVKKIKEIGIKKERYEAEQRVRRSQILRTWSSPSDVVIRPVRYYNMLFIDAGFINADFIDPGFIDLQDL